MSLHPEHVHCAEAEGDGIEPNISRPRGVQVWIQDCNDRVYTVDYGDPCGAPSPRCGWWGP